MEIALNEVKDNEYYLINGRRVLYRQNGEWWEAVKDRQGRYGSYISPLEKQPKIIKKIESYNTGY